MFYLVITLFVLLLISYAVNKGNYIAPSFLFTASFLFSSIWAFAFEKKWELNLHPLTYYVITISVVLFLIISGIVNSFYIHRIQRSKSGEIPLVLIDIEKWKLVLMVIIEIAASVLTIYSVMRLTGTNSISTAIYLFDNNAKYASNKYELPKIIGWMRTASLGAGYWFSPVLANNFILRKDKKKFPIFELVIVLFSMINYLATGGRQGTINIALSLISCYILLLHKQKRKEYKKVEKIFIARTIIVFIVFLWSFRYVAGVIGRNNQFDFWEYLALYCGASIKNLDMFIREGVRNSALFGGDTFHNLYVIIEKLVGTEFPKIVPYSYYRRINGFELGNVYTAFKSYIYDFGIIGNFALVAIYAFNSQLTYVRAVISKPTRKPAFSVILYGWITYTLLLSFFAEKYFELFNIISVQWMIIWMAYYLFFIKIKIKH